MRGEEAADQLLDAERQALREAQQSAQQTERALRDQLAAQGIALAQTQSQGAALQQRVDDLQQRFTEEKKSHDAPVPCSQVRRLRCASRMGHAGLLRPRQSLACNGHARIDARKPPGLAPRE